MIDYIILGIIQGIFEWLPISSEGIVALVSNFLISDINPIDIAIFLHIGTFLAVMIYFRKEWFEVFSLRDKRLFYFLALTTIISLIIGFFLYNIIGDLIFGAFLLFLMGLGLLITSLFHKLKERKLEKSGLRLRYISIIAGILQGLSVIPGLSRSGSTIFGLSFSKLRPHNILKFSYMMSAPIILISAIYLLIKSPILIQAWPALIMSFFVGYLSLHILIKISQKVNFAYFALLFGILCLLGAVIILL